MGYSTFLDAYVAFISQYNNWRVLLNDLDGWGTQMMAYAAADEWQNAFAAALGCFNTIETIHITVLDMVESNFRNNHLFECLRLAYLDVPDGEAYELTMDDLINVMLQANPEQVKYFVGLVDAYRQSLWNQPFNEELFAALARGFEQWG